VLRERFISAAAGLQVSLGHLIGQHDPCHGASSGFVVIRPGAVILATAINLVAGLSNSGSWPSRIRCLDSIGTGGS
jgi:hypothetical protein